MRQIKSTNYFVNDQGEVFTSKGKKRKPWVHKGQFNEYLRVTLTVDGKRKGLRVHRLVAETFIDNPLNKPEIDHIDGNTFNNNVNNLRWCTSKENKKFLKQRIRNSLSKS